MLPPVKLIYIGSGILSGPAKAAGLFFEDYTTLLVPVPWLRSVARIMQGHNQPKR